MALYQASIPDLSGGVSQRPPQLRTTNQCALQENGWSSLDHGVHKRPGSVHLSGIENFPAGAFVHTINRSPSEQYIVVITNLNLFVYDINGNQKTVTSTSPVGFDYLNALFPVTAYVAVTNQDYTIILNRAIPTLVAPLTAGGTYKGQVQRFVDLPTTGNVANDVWQIVGDDTNKFDNYFVKWDGVLWRETIQPGMAYHIDANWMPHKLTRNSDGTFTFAPIDWNDRLVGNYVSNPDPSFLGRGISDVFFFRDRLGFVSDSRVCLSRQGDYFNFFAFSATEVLDTDPIDISISHTSVALINYVVPYDRSLLLVTDSTQFLLSAPDVLTPSTVSISVASEFATSKLCRPERCGGSLYLTSERAPWQEVRDFYLAPNQTGYASDNLVEHVSRYITGVVVRMASSPQADMLFVLSQVHPDVLWVYKTAFQDNQRLQSSWSIWHFDPADVILNMDVLGEYLVLLVQRQGNAYLDRINLQPMLTETDLPFKVCLDRTTVQTGTYDPNTNLTTWTLPYLTTGDGNGYQAVLGPAFAGQVGYALPLTLLGTTQAQAVGNYSAGSVYIGRTYHFQYVFSPIFLRGENQRVEPGAEVRLKYLNLLFNHTGQFQVNVTPAFRPTSTLTYTGAATGLSTFGAARVADGSFRVPVLSDAATCRIEITNDSPYPCGFHGVEWEGTVIQRRERT
jgi:hypothetical protein